MKKTIAILCALAMIFAIGAVQVFAAPAETYNIGVCQLVQHPALDAATQGFMDTLTDMLGEDAVSFSVQNASGDSATCAVICSQFVSDEVDLILANATPALLAAQSATNKIPILGTSVTDYASALAIDDWAGSTGTNISGTSDGVPADAQAELLQEVFPDAKNVGLLYCSGEPNSKFQADQIRPILEEMGYKVADYTFADSNDVAQVTANACDDCDVLYIPTDNTAASNAELINNVALGKKVPIVAGEEGLCSGCGAVTLSISYYDLGCVTGQMAAEILAEGADVSAMEIEYAPFTGKYNAANCEALGVEIPEGFETIEVAE
ncbi:MAG: ABC transporter substrate-binding protein [Oscillospiraceae bacterium]|nr:ABC transporter substrate-binding protein [Oscillospiraceae bacterium]